MKASPWLQAAVLSLIPTSLVAASHPSRWTDHPQGGPPSDVAHDRFLIEVSHLDDLLTRRGLSPRAAHEELYDHLRKRDIGFSVNREFNSYGIFVGASVTLDDPSDKHLISSIPGVQAIRPVVYFRDPKPLEKRRLVDIDNIDPALKTRTPHFMTGVDKLHAMGLTGKGIKVGIIDSGIDYTHPALGGGFGPGFKVIGGFDFIGDNVQSATANTTRTPDMDPSDCNGHGTFVAGVIGADPHNNPMNISGVAPDALLSSYRVLGCAGDVPEDAMIAAMLRAEEDGQDILNLSVGIIDGWVVSSASVVADRLAAKGMIVVSAAGNDGSDGAWLTSRPASAIDTISVAAVDNAAYPLYYAATVHGIQNNPIPYFTNVPLPVNALPVNGTLPIFALSKSTSVVDDACEPLPDSTPDLSGFVTIVRRGTCSFEQKLTNIAAKGGIVSLIYNDRQGLFTAGSENFTVATIQESDGVALVNAFAAGQEVLLSFPQSESVALPLPTGGLVSSISTVGPTNDMYFKPSIAAPGGFILSTIPVNLGSYDIKFGTSFSSPFVAGVAALLLEAKGKSPSVAHSIRTLFQTTAEPIPSNHTNGSHIQSLAVQGAGLIDAYAAVTTDVIVSPGVFLLNDTSYLNSTHTFTVHNTGKVPKTFAITHLPAGTALTMKAGTYFPAGSPTPLSDDYASVELSHSTITVSPGETASVTAVFTPPKVADPSVLPVYSGYIQISDAGQSLRVSYLGLAASLKDVKVVDTTDSFGEQFPALHGPGDKVISEPSNFTLVGEDIPKLIWRLNFGSPKLVIDLVKPDIIITTTVERRSNSSLTPEKRCDTFSQVETVGRIDSLDYIPRNSIHVEHPSVASFKPINAFSNGTAIPDGSYRILLRVLKVTGDPKEQWDYETWLSPILTVQTPPKNS